MLHGAYVGVYRLCCGEERRDINTCCDVTHLCRITVSIVDQERNKPARDGYFGSLIREDEEGAQHRRLIADGLPKESQFRRFRRLSGRISGSSQFERIDELNARVLFKGAESPPGEHKVHDRYTEGEEIEMRPDDTVSDHGGGNQWADGAADPIATVEHTESGGAIDEVGAENVVHGQVDGHAETGEEEALKETHQPQNNRTGSEQDLRYHDHRIGWRAYHHNVPGNEYCFGQR